MSANAYPGGYPRWWVTVELDLGQGVEYKYYEKSGGWETGGNRMLDLKDGRGCAGEGRVVVDEW